MGWCTGRVTPDDTVCVVGSSHSAILVLMNLLEMQNGPRAVNLYRSSLKYAKFRSDGTIILDNTGLKVMSLFDVAPCLLCSASWLQPKSPKQLCCVALAILMACKPALHQLEGFLYACRTVLCE